MRKIADLPASMRAVSTVEELGEVLAVLNGKGEAMKTILKKEKPQKDYKLVNDEPVCVGYLEMFTVESDFFDELGRNRKGSTFGMLGLKELGINPAECEVIQ
jgi:hypothetical protein